MAATRADSVLRQIRTLFRLGHVGDRSDRELLDWFEVHRTEAEIAFEELVARHGAMVLDVCRRVLRDPNDVDDAFQATFLVLMRRAGSIRDRDSLGGWLHRVALRVALRAKSDAARRREVEQKRIAAEVSESPANDLEMIEIGSALHEELDRIPESYRAALIACHLEGLTHEEAASRLRWPVGTVRSRLARGREKLRDRLTRRGFAPSIILPLLARSPEILSSSWHRLAVESMFAHATRHSLAGKVSAPVAALSEGVIRAMNLRALKIIAATALSVSFFAIALPFVVMSSMRPVQAAAQKSSVPTSLVGVVKDTDGKPVEGATVVAGAFTMEPNHQVATTDANGRFAFKSQPAKRPLEYVMAYKEGLAPASKFNGLGETPKPNREIELTLLKPSPFLGTVYDRAGKPIKGAKVRIRYMRGRGGKYDHNPILENILKETPLDSLFLTSTDEQGGFRFPAVPDPKQVVIQVTAEGMADLSSEVPGNYDAGFIAGTPEKPAKMTMAPEARIVGRIVTKLPGVSVARIKIGLQSTNDSPQFWRDVKTDAEGRFEMRGLPEGGGNLYPMDHPNDGPWTYRAIDNLALHPGKTAEVTIELIMGVLVEGQVVDEVTGDPIAGHFIGMYGPARPHSGAAILSATTDKNGQYRFHLPPGKTRLYTASASPQSYAGQEVDIPEGVLTFTAPTLRLKMKEPPPKPVEKSKAVEIPEKPPVLITGLVQDVSDQPIEGATVVGAILHGDLMVDRKIVSSGADGRFSLELDGSKRDQSRAIVYAFKEGLAPASVGGDPRLWKPDSPGSAKLTLATTRPFFGLVEDKNERPIAGADVRVQSLKAPVLDGAGMAVTEISWDVVEGTPLEAALRTASDGEGKFRLSSMPARSVVNLVVASQGKRAHRTTDFTQPGMTGRWPSGFDAGFLHGTADAPATLYLDPDEPGRIQQVKDE